MKRCGRRGLAVVWMKVIAVNLILVRRGSVDCREGVGGKVLVLGF